MSALNLLRITIDVHNKICISSEVNQEHLPC